MEKMYNLSDNYKIFYKRRMVEFFFENFEFTINRSSNVIC